MSSCVETRRITIKPRRDPTDYSGFKFDMLENGQPVPNDTLQVSKTKAHKQTDYHTFIFTVENADDTDLKFIDNPFDVMWVTPGNNCPKHRTHDMDFNIGAIDSEHLTVHNANSRQCSLKFVLNFVGTKADGSRGIIAYDPIWTNNNGGSR